MASGASLGFENYGYEAAGSSGPSMPTGGPMGPATASGPSMPTGGPVGSEKGDGPESFQPVQMPVIDGYEFVNHILSGESGDFTATCIQPPSYEEATRVASAPSIDNSDRIHVDETQAREALLEEVNKNCCYGANPAKELVFNNISTSYALHYTLNTFTEKRDTYWAKVPYAPGQPVDGPAYGPAPGPWDIPCQASQMFVDQESILEVPHTSNVQACNKCHGRGRIMCPKCHGRGHNNCVFCHGSGHTSSYDHNTNQHRNTPCTSCGGRGRQNCIACCSSGYVRCPTCTGFGQLRYYIALKVTFKDNLSEQVIQYGGFPTTTNLSKAAGYEQCRQEGTRVLPLDQYPVEEVRQFSRTFIEQAANQFTNMRILMQRQVLRSVPVSECRYTWNEKPGVFWVYGTDNRVEMVDYPQTCCCCCCGCSCCTIL